MTNSKSIWGDENTQYFYELTPDHILNTIDSIGLKTTGRLLQLNSMENRVYEIEVEDLESETESKPLVSKFYRPKRWSFDQINEEHNFLHELEKQEIPIIAPALENEKSLYTDDQSGIHFCLYPKKGGRTPDEFNEDELLQLGRLIGRVHSVGKKESFTHRPTLSVDSHIIQNGQACLESEFLPMDVKSQFEASLKQLETIAAKHLDSKNYKRIHGDCHFGNLIKREETFYLVDFDDCINGPEFYDIWTLFPRDDEHCKLDRSIFLEGYEEFHSFSMEQYKLAPLIQAIRMINYAAWITKRWGDPTFPQHFPFIQHVDYWYNLNRELGDIARKF